MYEEPILKVRNLRKQFGPGCCHCENLDADRLEKITAQTAAQFMQFVTCHLMYILVRFWGSSEKAAAANPH